MRLSLQDISRPHATLLSSIVVILTPYLSRLAHGINWMMDYLPSDPMALLFFVGFAAIPAAVIWSLIYRWPGRSWPHCYWATLGVTTLFLASMHHDYDMSADPQSAVGLIIIPVLAGSLAAAVYCGVRLLLWCRYR